MHVEHIYKEASFQGRPYYQYILVLICLFLAWPGSAFSDSTEEYINSAKNYISNNDIKAAVIELKNALQQDADSTEARFLLGQVYLEIGDALSAEKEIRRAIKTGLPRKKWIGSLGRVLIMKNNALKILNEIKVTDKDPDELKVKIHALRSQAQIVLKNYTEARAEMAKAENLASKNLVSENKDALLGYARLAALDKDSSLALEYVEKAINKDKEDIDALMMQGELYHQMDEPKKAIEAFSNALKFHPEYWMARIGKLVLYFSMKEYVAAENEIKELKRIQAKNPLVLYFEAVLAHHKKDLDLAQNNLQLVLRVIPDHLPSHLLIGSIYYAKGEFESADTHLSKYLAVNPGYVPAIKLMAAIKLKSKQVDSAIKLLQSIGDSMQTDPQMLALMGTAYLQKKDYSKGTEYLERAAKLAPDVAAIRTQLAMSNLGGGDIAKAISQLETAVEMGQGVLQADVMLIIVHLKEKKFDKALLAAEKLISKRPDDPMPHNLISAAYMGKGDTKAMRTHLEKALEIDPRFSTARVNLAKLYEKDGDLENAKKQYKEIVNYDAKNIKGMIGLSRLADQKGSSKEALDWLKKAHEANSSSIEPGILMTRYYLKKNDGLKALSLARELSSRKDDHPVILTLLGSAQLLAGETLSAVKTYEKAVQLSREDPVAHYSLAHAYVIAKNYDKAKVYFNKAIELNNRHLPSLFELAVVELETGNIKEAERITKQIQELYPENVVGFQLEGDILLKKGEENKAIEKYNDAYKKQPGDQLVQVIYKLYKKSGENKKSVGALKKHLVKFPDNFNVRLALAGEYQSQGKNNEAIQEYEKLAELKSDSLIVWNNLAWLYFEGSDNRALKSAEKAYELAPQRPEVVDTYGWIVLHQGSPEKALRLLQDAAIHAPHVTQIRYHLAVAQYKLGKHKEALKELSRILRTGNSFPEKDEAKILFEKLKNR